MIDVDRNRAENARLLIQRKGSPWHDSCRIVNDELATVSIVKVLAYEYGSGGGLIDGPASPSSPSPPSPPSHTHQGDMVLHALVSDLVALPELDVVTIRDRRLPQLDLPASVYVVHYDGDGEACFDECLQAVDAVWPVAPGYAGILERLSLKIARRKRILLGSRAGAVRIASSRRRTAQKLEEAGVPVVAAYFPDEALPESVATWVVKQDDGAGLGPARIFHGAGHALDWIRGSGHGNDVLQPFVSGKPCSMSLLCCRGAVHVLSCDEQRVAVRNETFHYLGTVVNSMSSSALECTHLARRIARAMPGLWGYVAVNFIQSDKGPVVLGISPCLTAAYVGLHASIGCNPAGLVLALLASRIGRDPPAYERRPVNVDVQAFR